MIDKPLAPEVDTFFTKENLKPLDPFTIPKHVAIIPDGNRRWAQSKGFFNLSGHRVGAQAVIDIVLAAQELGIQAITFYNFSTENWKRSTLEVNTLMDLLEEFLYSYADKMKQKGVRFSTIGEISKMPPKVQKAIEEVKQLTAPGHGIHFILAINYGGRDEICRAAVKMAKDIQSGSVKVEDVTEIKFSGYLDTHLWPDPELIIRTSGEMRISNFLLWQGAYAEWVNLPIFWPDFKPDHFLNAVIEYQGRQRRFGGG